MWVALCGGVLVQICCEARKVWRYNKERKELIELANKLAIQSLTPKQSPVVKSITDLPKGEYEVSGNGKVRMK